MIINYEQVMILFPMCLLLSYIHIRANAVVDASFQGLYVQAEMSLMQHTCTCKSYIFLHESVGSICLH